MLVLLDLPPDRQRAQLARTRVPAPHEQEKRRSLGAALRADQFGSAVSAAVRATASSATMESAASAMEATAVGTSVGS